MTHVKFQFRKQGFDPDLFESVFFRQLLGGLDKSFPTDNDKRIALLLPEYIKNPVFMCRSDREYRRLRLATILGFIRMLRPHTFDQIRLESFTFITQGNERISFKQLRKQNLTSQA